MSEELTKKWKNGTLSLNYYYIKLQSGKYGIDHTVMSIDGDLPKTKFAYSNFAIEEVLAPVPTYDEYKELVFKANKPANPLSDCMMTYDTEREKEIVAPLLEQLKEANELIKDYGDEYPNVVSDYIKKWGVK